MTDGQAFARVGLLGNPSDGYRGRVIALTLRQFRACVTVSPADSWECEIELLQATVAALEERRPELVSQPGALSFSTTIPRQVGLSGSSAIIIAACRALAKRAGGAWEPVELAKTALEVETHVLGWAAGPQDRVVQSIEGLVDMDFDEPWNSAAYEQLSTDALPTLFVAWNQNMGTPSDVAHAQVRERWLSGDPRVLATMADFAQLAVDGRAALDAGTAADEWPGLLDRAFELRSRIWNITDVDTALVNAGTSAGAGVAFAGSGGAVVGCPRDASQVAALEASYRNIGAGFLVIE